MLGFYKAETAPNPFCSFFKGEKVLEFPNWWRKFKYKIVSSFGFILIGQIEKLGRNGSV